MSTNAFEEAHELFLHVATPEERLAHDSLTPGERTGIVRDGLFRATSGLREYARVTGEDIAHGNGCQCRDKVAGRITPRRVPTLEQKSVQLRVRMLLTVEPAWTLTTTPRDHVVWCRECGAYVVRPGVLATFTTRWGNEYSREFAVDE